MPKDNESVPLPLLSLDGPADKASAQPFAADQMLRCDECLRANPPTRVNCLYCGATLPQTETSENLQKPTIRPLDKWERGYNNILQPSSEIYNSSAFAEAADVLNTSTNELENLLSLKGRLPIARTPTSADALIVQRRLGRLGIDTSIVSDEQLGIDGTRVVKIRAMEIDDDGIHAFQSPDAAALDLPWTAFVLIVLGRLVTRRVELQERKSRGAESRITNSSEFFTDEEVIDLYAGDGIAYRIAANSFDFSCLRSEKSLLASENISKLLSYLKQRLPGVPCDTAYVSLRKVLETVWPAEQRNESRGLSREGRNFSIGSVVETSNEMQFHRYSRLRYFLLTQGGGGPTDEGRSQP